MTPTSNYLSMSVFSKEKRTQSGRSLQGLAMWKGTGMTGLFLKLVLPEHLVTFNKVSCLWFRHHSLEKKKKI